MKDTTTKHRLSPYTVWRQELKVHPQHDIHEILTVPSKRQAHCVAIASSLLLNSRPVIEPRSVQNAGPAGYGHRLSRKCSFPSRSTFIVACVQRRVAIIQRDAMRSEGHPQQYSLVIPRCGSLIFSNNLKGQEKTLLIFQFTKSIFLKSR